ncbi:sensor histidine kinase [Terrisporobacter vanillatitrophus]|uniref:sensor histidine kinase n=1 Tax=Terrisporobacter vanillatitrophus TaxID=3058402 RepID=UPI003365F8FF
MSSVGIYFSLDKVISNISYQNKMSIIALIIVFQIIQGFILLFSSMSISKKALHQVDIMIDDVKDISFKNLNKRLDVSGVKNELKDLARTFNAMLDSLEKSMEVQNQFVSDASHELRTPLAIIQGYSNLLTRWGKDDKEVLEESVNAIKEEAESMKKLIESLLFLSRGDKKTQIIKKTDFQLDCLIDEVIKESKMIDENHNIICNNNEKICIHGDKGLIKEAIRIFMDNSIKYTPENKTIKLNTFLKTNGVYIVIEDEGIGISKEDQSKIFNRFYRCDESRNKNTGGSGLGLAIAKYIVEEHGGIIKIYSKINEGTIISVELNF